MTVIRKIKTVFKSKPVIEGAGVHLKRVFGYSEVPLCDPFLMMDDFRSDTPEHYLKGFPWHPHRGIETITYVLKGDVTHGDSLGNKGVIHAEDVQWMTAGSGIIHQEMPTGDKDGRMYGFQLWANLPSSRKMMEPRYQEIPGEKIPKVSLENGGTVKIIAGNFNGIQGPIKDIVIDPEYFDIFLPENSSFRHLTHHTCTLLAYVIEGRGDFSGGNPILENGTAALFDTGDEFLVRTKKEPVRFILISGKPIGEPVAWRGPIVMNTREELDVAFEEYQNGTFIKKSK